MGAQILNVEPGHHCPPLATTLRQACNQLGTPGSVKTEEFSERGQHFLNYAQHIYVGGLRPPPSGYGPALRATPPTVMTVASGTKAQLSQIENATSHEVLDFFDEYPCACDIV